MKVAALFSELNQMPESLPDLSVEGAPTMIREGASLSPVSRKITGRLKPLLDRAFEGPIAGGSVYGKQFEATNRLIMAQMVRNVARTSQKNWIKEATLAGTDIPSYQRQMIALILRAYPKMYATQLFPTVPFAGPDARIYFKVTQYDTAYTGSAPNISQGDLLTDLTKFNKDFAQRDQAQTARQLKTVIDSIAASVKSYRVTADWTYEAADDMESLYGEALDSSLLNELATLVGWTTDRTLIDAAVADANSQQSWTAQPPGYSSLQPTEKKAYDETIWSNGILPLITQIQRKRLMTSYPTWFVVGTNLAERIQKLNAFVPFANAQGDAIEMNVGALRDIGTLRSVGIRVLVDQQLDVDTGLMGYRPASSFDPAIIYGPYKPIKITGRLETPSTGEYEQGVYSRFAAVRKDTVHSASSAQLGDPYGVFTVV